MEAAFQAYGRPLKAVNSLKYLRRVLTAFYDEYPVVVKKLRKARRKCVRFSSILVREGTKAWTSGTLYKAAVQANLLFGSETWVMTPRIGRILGGFYHRLDHCLAGMNPRNGTAGRWEYPPLEAEMAAAGLEEVDAYVLRRQYSIAQ